VRLKTNRYIDSGVATFCMGVAFFAILGADQEHHEEQGHDALGNTTPVEFYQHA